MTKLTILHNPACSKSRATKELLEKFGKEFQVIEYLKTPPTAGQLDSLLKMLKLGPEEIVRKGEDRFSELGLDQNPPKTREAWIRVLVENPVLIERPIVSDGKRAVVGRPPERVKELF